MNRIRWYGPTLLLVLTVLVIMMTGPNMVRELTHAQRSAEVRLIQNELENNVSLTELSRAFRKVAKVVEPSVVHIEVAAKDDPRRQAMEEDMMRRFFGPRARPEQPQQQAPQDQYERYNVPRPQRNGSGWVFDESGHIITNNHVVDTAESITVRFHDGSQRKATIVGQDPLTDVAVIKVEGNGLIPASLAREEPEQGDIVFAFGSPYGFEFSMSQGIVSAKGRQLNIIRQGYENFIQTDAAINRGNSGGPLTNVYGQVIGMNTAIASGTGGGEGLGFAIPVDMVKDVVDRLINDGKVVRGWLGIAINELDPRMAQTFGYQGKGVLVESAMPDGPAAAAGLAPGDIITKIDARTIESVSSLQRTVANYAPGSKMTIGVFRGGKNVDLEVTVTARPENPMLSGGGTTPSERAPADVDLETLRKLGLVTVTTFTEEAARQMNMEFTPGVLLRRVRPQSVAQAAGLIEGQLITHVMDTPIADAKTLADEINKHDVSKGIRLSVGTWDPRGRRYVPRFVLLELPQ